MTDRTRITRNLLMPVVNLNGMGAVELAGLYLDVSSALRLANKAMGEAMPHGRDYQTMPLINGQEPAVLARAAVNERRQVLLELEREYEEMALAIHRQKEAR